MTERLSIIATKDGFITSQNPLVQDGFADVAAGLKYNVYRDVETQTIASVGTTFEMPVGSTRSLQGNGDGEFHLFATGGTEFLPYWHWVSGTGFRLPVDRAAENQLWYWSNHIGRVTANSGVKSGSTPRKPKTRRATPAGSSRRSRHAIACFRGQAAGFAACNPRCATNLLAS